MSDIYSNSKHGVHLASLLALRQGRKPFPVHVQLILSDLCNQNCSFCLLPGSNVLTFSGEEVAIESIQAGDKLRGPDGKSNTVIKTWSREVEEYLEVSIGNRTLRLTQEHPVLTEQGWIEAGLLHAGDSAFMQVRMRGTSEEKQSWQLLEPIRSVSQPAITLPSRNVGGSQEAHVGSHAGKQSHAQSRDSSQSIGHQQRQATQEIKGRHRQHSQSCTQTHAWSWQPHEESCNGSESMSGCNVPTDPVQNRNAVFQVGRKKLNLSRIHRAWNAVVGAVQSRLQGAGTEKGYRDHAEISLYQQTHRQNAGAVCKAAHSQDCEDGVAVIDCVYAGSQEKPERRDGGRDQIVRVGGVELERGVELQRIDAIRRVYRNTVVYDVTCERVPAFFAEGVVVHNCAYRQDAGLSTELFRGANGEINPNRKIPTAKAKEILLDAKELGAKAVQFTGGGEPSVHPDWVGIIEYAGELGLERGLVTNGTKLDQCPSDLDWVRISVDAGTAETYQSVRKSDRYDEVLNKVCDFTARAHQSCVVGIGFVVTPDNYGEIVQGIEAAKSTGASYVRLSAMFTENGTDPFPASVRQAAADSIHIGKLAYEDESFKVIDLFSDRMHDLDAGSPDYDLCGYQHFTTYIGGDQCVYRCCNTAYTNRGKIGDLSNQSLLRWWASFSVGHLDDFCARGCKFCQFNLKNRAIMQTVQGDQQHVNFV